MEKIIKYTNEIAKTTRRIRAYFRQSNIKRIKAIMFIALVISSFFSSAFAIENTKINYSKYKIKSYIDPLMYVSYYGRPQPNYEYFYETDKGEVSAYCLNLGYKGAEDVSEGYDVDVREKIQDENLKKIVLGGYPYVSIKELGLNNQSEARFATQFAIWAYLENLNLDEITPINSSNLNVVNAIKNIYYSKDKDISSFEISLDLKYSPTETMMLEDGLNFAKKINIEKTNIKNLKLNSLNDNLKIIQNGKDNSYYACMKVDNVTNTQKAKINVEYSAKENVVLFGKTTLDGFQDMVVTLEESFDDSFESEIEFEKYETKVKIIKTDGVSRVPLEGVKFNAMQEDGTFIGTYTTDSNGEIEIVVNNVKKTKIIVQEIETLNNYELDEEEKEIEIDVNDYLELNFTNRLKQGRVEILKLSKEYNEKSGYKENTPLQDVRFNILDENGNVVATVITDKYGSAISPKLPFGKYYIREIETCMYYELLDHDVEIEIKDDVENLMVEILNNNEKVEEQIPVTGM